MRPPRHASYSPIPLVVMVALAISGNVAAQNPPQGLHASSLQSASARVDTLFEQWNSSESPGCSLGVSRDGALAYERGYGMANLELGVPITPASVFHVASVSKQFTAMSLLLLAERGLLSLDDDVRKFVPELPDYGDRLTLRHLLTHTSGLRDWFSLQALTEPDDNAWTEKFFVETLARQRQLNFTPGSEYQYLNSGYMLLGIIVRRVSGQSLGVFADSNIFKPLGMANSHFHDSPTVLVPNRASGHRRGSSGFQVELDDWAWAGRGEPVLVGNTGLFTTSRDLLLWEQNFGEVRVGNPTLVAAMQEPTILGSGEVSLYGFGLQIGTHRGLRTIAHGGSDPGYSAYVVRYPAQGLAIAVLCNLEGISTARLARSVADVYLEHLFTAPGSSSTPAGPTVVPLSPQEQARYVGLFYDHVNHTFRSVFIRDGRLMVSPRPDNSLGVELTAVGANRFLRPGGIVVEYVPGSAEQDPQYREGMEGQSPGAVFQMVTPFAPSNTELLDFAGQYASSELNTLYTLAARNAELVLQVKGRAPVALRPVFPDAFHGLIGLVRFSRDTQRRITGFTVNTSDVRGLHFDRVTR